MKKTKICLAWHNLNSNNYGVSALGVAQVGLLLDAANRAGISIDMETLGTPFVSELKIKEEVEQRFSIHLEHHNFSLKEFVMRLLKFDFSLLNIFKKYDIVMDIGEGDSFTDIYGFKRYMLFCLTKYLAIASGKVLVLSPQTIGPFNHGVSRVIAKYLMSRADAVFSRDQKSTQFVRDMNIKCVEVSDVAFTLPYDIKPKQDDTVGINISGLLWNGGYSGGNQFGLTVDYHSFVKQIITGFRFRGKQVHLVAHVITDDIPVEDDYRVCQAIKQLFLSDDGVIVAPKFKSPIEAKSYMSQLEFFTGSRMHATIGSLSSGVVTVPIAYSRKFSGVFGSLDYNYTLDAYALDTDGLIKQLFDYYDHQFQEMHDAMINARKKASERNEEYVSYLQRMLTNA